MKKNRIKEQREAKGWSLEQLGIAIGSTRQQAWKLESGHVRLSQDWLEKLSVALGCSVLDLLPAKAQAAITPALGLKGSASAVKRPLRESSIIEEMDVRLSSGHDALTDSGDTHQVIAEWQMPSEFVRSHTTTPTERIKILPVNGDSNVPDFPPGDRVLVDTEDTHPSPPGVFVLWDGLGFVLKRVEIIPNSDPLMVRLIPRNTQYQIYERPLADVQIKGRVIGKWART